MVWRRAVLIKLVISIHKALASLDLESSPPSRRSGLFQSTRLSRASTVDILLAGVPFPFQSTRLSRASTLPFWLSLATKTVFQSTRLSRASTTMPKLYVRIWDDFNPQGSREPRQQNYPTIPPHPPNFLCIMSSPPYFNLLHPFTQPIFTAFPLFFRCESPRHFMLAWHSHLV